MKSNKRFVCALRCCCPLSHTPASCGSLCVWGEWQKSKASGQTGRSSLMDRLCLCVWESCHVHVCMLKEDVLLWLLSSFQGGACWSPMVDTRSEEVWVSFYFHSWKHCDITHSHLWCHHHTDDTLITAAVLCLFLSIRFLWAHSRHKHSQQRDQTVWQQQEDDICEGGSVISWSSREVWGCTAAVWNWPDWSLLLGGRVERNSWYISDLQKNQKERRKKRLCVWTEWSVLVPELLWWWP